MSAAVIRKYETIVVTRTDAGPDAQRRLYDRIVEMMSQAEATQIRFELWGKRRLAYPIAKGTKGIYMYFMYMADNTFVKELNRMLKLSNITLRYLTVRLSDALDPTTVDFEDETYFDAPPSETEEASDYSRAVTGWEAEFEGKSISLVDDAEGDADDADDDDADDDDVDDFDEEDDFDEDEEEEEV